MATVNDYYKYAQLATASYVDLSQLSALLSPDGHFSFNDADLIRISNDQKRMPTVLARQFFDSSADWRVLGDPRNPLPGGGVLHDDPARQRKLRGLAIQHFIFWMPTRIRSELSRYEQVFLRVLRVLCGERSFSLLFLAVKAFKNIELPSA